MPRAFFISLGTTESLHSLETSEPICARAGALLGPFRCPMQVHGKRTTKPLAIRYQGRNPESSEARSRRSAQRRPTKSYTVLEVSLTTSIPEHFDPDRENIGRLWRR